MYIAIETHKH